MSDRSDGSSWANHRMPSDPRSGTNVDDCEIGVWDPNSVNKSYPANNSSQYHMPSSNAWASSEQSNPNYSYGNYNNHQDYTSQLTSQAQNLSINAVSSQNSNLYYSGEPPVPQAAPYVQQRQEPMPTLTNTAPSRHENHSRRSDSTNWRNPIPSYNLPQESSSYNAPYSADAQYQQQRSQYSNQAPSQNWSSFQNPLLSGNNDEDEESPEVIVERMKQSKAAAKLAAEELL
uniref:Uncharacterized protein n=1 Tax=Ciona savignyi TaxID=51511 RepID=H2YPR8_CIOSA